MRFLATLPLLFPLLVAGPVARAPDPDPGPGPGRVDHLVAARVDLVDALEALHAWDSRRARAWAAADPVALRALYTRGSGAGRADLRLLRAYAGRGLVVRRIVTQVFAVRVLHRDASGMRLRVFDRVAGGEVVEDGHGVALPSSRPVTRDIDLRLGPGGWRVASVSGSGRGLRAARR